MVRMASMEALFASAMQNIGNFATTPVSPSSNVEVSFGIGSTAFQPPTQKHGVMRDCHHLLLTTWFHVICCDSYLEVGFAYSRFKRVRRKRLCGFYQEATQRSKFYTIVFPGEEVGKYKWKQVWSTQGKMEQKSTGNGRLPIPSTVGQGHSRGAVDRTRP
ncbi:hypothetical protein M9H77_31041 [Catharanthus roseus]|uniref:Uncharacterized protein n=1 Tax=Catharanthus roseus TaxID=4058 RepID=A0ACB9ZZT3_CATRO|nr:hypothetical protein M9H77_31041 [Catharanthus roseus]